MERIPELEPVEKILDQQLNTDAGLILAQQLVEIEAWGNRVSFMLYDAKRELSRMRDKYRVPKTQGLTDFDRTIMLDGAVKDYEAKADYLAAVQENIKRRISLGQTLLKNMRTELETSVNVK